MRQLQRLAFAVFGVSFPLNSEALTMSTPDCSAPRAQSLMSWTLGLLGRTSISFILSWESSLILASVTVLAVFIQPVVFVILLFICVLICIYICVYMYLY